MNGLDKEMGSSLFSKVRGEGRLPSLLILHGLFGSSDNLANIASLLSKNFNTHALDLRNHGRSFHSEQMDYESMASDVIDYIRSNSLKNVSIIGHSMGGKVAMTVALKYPKSVDRIIIADISPVKYPPHHSEILTGLSNLNSSTLTSRKQADEVLGQYVKEMGVRQFLLKNLMFDENRKLTLRLNLSAILNNYDNIMAGQALYCERYTKPVLFIAGGDSEYIQSHHRETVQSLFSNVQLKVIPDTSHWLHAEKPEMFARICERFLNNN